MDRNEKQIKEILCGTISYESITIGKVINLAEKIGFQSQCDGDSKSIRISLDLKNNEKGDRF